MAPTVELPDLTVNGDRYIRMPAKLMYVFFAGLVIATWAYFDLRSQAVQALDMGKANQLVLSSAVTDINSIKQAQATHDQYVNDFIESSERLYTRYFRDYGDPNKFGKFPH